MNRFICYIGGVALIFKLCCGAAVADASIVTTGVESDAEVTRQESMADHINSELGKFILLPFVADKLFAGDKLNQSMQSFLQLLYPTTDVEKLQKMEVVLRTVVTWKRKYDYAVDKLKRKIKALSMLPKNAPVVAADGEYAAAEEDLRKLSAPGEYQVRYRPFKYLEYDTGQFGEPVRRRDRNYVSPDEYNTDEVVLALLQFDFYGFMKAIGKMPTYRDGADEAPIQFGNGISARMLMDTVRLGDKKKVYGVLEIKLPEDMYISGDYLKPEGRPAFILTESGGKIPPGTVYIGDGVGGMKQVVRTEGLPEEGSRNVESYRLYQPLAIGVEKDGASKRILVGTVLFPIEIVRADTSKSMRFAGSFQFTLCRADGSCVPVWTHHGLTLPASETSDISLYYNYVTQGRTHQPERESRHAKVMRATYFPDDAKLAVEFAVTRSFSNVAVMVEDVEGTNFLAPRYEIGEDYVRAVFQVRGTYGGEAPKLGEIAVSASFNDREKLRTVIHPEYVAGGVAEAKGDISEKMASSVEPDGLGNVAGGVVSPETADMEKAGTFNGRVGETLQAVAIPAPKSLTLFWFGVMLMLMPGGFYLYFQLVRQLWMREDRCRIAFWYMTGAAIGLILFGLCYSGRYFGEMYQNPWLIAVAAAVMVPLFAESLGYMNMELFRPLKKFLPRGVVAGVFTVLLGMAFPGAFKPEALAGLMAAGVFIPSESLAATGGSNLATGVFPEVGGTAWIEVGSRHFWHGYALIWCGIAVLTLLVLTLRSRFVYPLEGFRRCNIIYNGVYLAGLLWITGVSFGIGAVIGLTAGMTLLFFIWYVFPLAAEDAVLRVRSEVRRKQIFERVQRHWLVAVLVWFGLVGGGLQLVGLRAPDEAEWLMPAVGKKEQVIDDDEAEAEAEGIAVADNVGADFDVPLLVVVEADYSPKSLYNRPALYNLARSGVRVVRIDASGNGLLAAPWFATYGRFYAPLAVLFTIRHRYGLVLPENLNDVDFVKAMAGWPQ